MKEERDPENGRSFLRQRERDSMGTFQFIQAEKARYSVPRLCWFVKAELPMGHLAFTSNSESWASAVAAMELLD